jgi:DNA-directed RNA polymerase subunit E"
MKKKVCKNCKIVVDGLICPICKKNAFTNNFQGQINVLDASKSFIAKKIDIKSKGDYAIKIN